MTSPTADRRQGLVGNTPIKAPVDCATTGAIALSGEQTIDGVLTNGSRVLVKNQADQTTNGIYDSSTGSWTRSVDADGTYDLTTGTVMLVLGGTINGNSFYQVSTPKPFTVGSSAIAFTQSLFSSASVLSYSAGVAGAVARSVESKLRESKSVMDFGAKGDNVTDDTAAFQAAFSWGYANGAEVTVPIIGVKYKITAGLSLAYTDGSTSLRIRGQSGGNYNTSAKGAVINFTHATADFLTITGVGPTMVDIEGLNVVGSSTGAAFKFVNAWMNRVSRNIVNGFAAGVSLVVQAGGGFCGDTDVDWNRFELCSVAALLLSGDNTGGQINCVSMWKNHILDTGTPVSSNWGGNLPDLHDVNVIDNRFENWTSSAIAVDGVVQGLSIRENYLEKDGAVYTGTWINLGGSGNTAVDIQGNRFVGTLNAAGQKIVAGTSVSGITMLNNFCSDTAGTQDRFTCDLVSCTGVDVEPVRCLGGARGFPVRINTVAVNSRVNENWLGAMPTGAGKFVGFSTGDGFPGGSVSTLNTNQCSKSNGRAFVELDITLTTKSGSGTSLLVGVFPYSNAGGALKIPLRTSGISGGTAPYYGLLANGGTTFSVIDSAASPATIGSTSISVGATLYAGFSYPTKD